MEIKQRFVTFVSKNKIMSGDHKEAEQNEIGGPVLFTVICVALESLEFASQVQITLLVETLEVQPWTDKETSLV